MYTIQATKEFTWDMAHLLAEHEGLCKNLHGHTYKMEVTVEQVHGGLVRRGAAGGMVVDFKELKEVIKELIVDPLDHALMLQDNSSDEFEKALLLLAQAHDKKVYIVPYRPTAENMSLHFMRTINTTLTMRANEYRVKRLRLYETPTSYAEVID